MFIFAASYPTNDSTTRCGVRSIIMFHFKFLCSIHSVQMSDHSVPITFSQKFDSFHNPVSFQSRFFGFDQFQFSSHIYNQLYCITLLSYSFVSPNTAYGEREREKQNAKPWKKDWTIIGWTTLCAGVRVLVRVGWGWGEKDFECTNPPGQWHWSTSARGPQTGRPAWTKMSQLAEFHTFLSSHQLIASMHLTWSASENNIQQNTH